MKNVHVITGGSSGIGLECAKMFKDDIVLITGRNEDRLINAKNELEKDKIQVFYKTSDISKKNSIKELLDYAKTLGKIKTVINSAGVSGVGVSAKLTFDIDLLGTENLIKETFEAIDEDVVLILISSMMGYVIPDNEIYNDLLKNPSEEGAINSLVNIVENNPDNAYNFSKKGVHLLVKKYANKFGEKASRILSVSPGIIMTPMSEKAAEEYPERMGYMKSMTPVGRNGEPEDIAEIVSFLASEKASFITGTDFLVDGGLTVNMPEIIRSYTEQ